MTSDDFEDYIPSVCRKFRRVVQVNFVSYPTSTDCVLLFYFFDFLGSVVFSRGSKKYFFGALC